MGSDSLMFALPDPAQAAPLAGTAVLFAFMLKMVWGARAEWVLEKATMSREWKAERATMKAENEAALQQMQANCSLTTESLRRLHIDELASLNRRIDALEAQIAQGKL